MGQCRPGRRGSRRAVPADPALARSRRADCGCRQPAAGCWPGQHRPSAAQALPGQLPRPGRAPVQPDAGLVSDGTRPSNLPGTSHKALLPRQPRPYHFTACRMPKPRRLAYEGMNQQARRILHADQNHTWSLNVTRMPGCHVPYRRIFAPSGRSNLFRWNAQNYRFGAMELEVPTGRLLNATFIV